MKKDRISTKAEEGKANHQKNRVASQNIRRRYSDFFDFAPVGYFTFNRDGLILDVNPHGAFLLGTEKPSLLNQHLSHFLSPDSKKVFERHSQRLFETRQKKICDVKLLKGNQDTHWIQLESMDSMDRWKKLGCPVLTLDNLMSFLQRLDQLTPILCDGGGPALNGEEIEQLKCLGEKMQLTCGELSRYSIPLALVHPDMWKPKLIAKNGEFQIADWWGTVLSHPFFSILKLIRFRELSTASLPAAKEDDKKLKKIILDAYLEPFTRFENIDRLQTAMVLARKLQPAWRLYKWSQEVSEKEPDSVSYHFLARHLQIIAKQTIDGEAS